MRQLDRQRNESIAASVSLKREKLIRKDCWYLNSTGKHTHTLPFSEPLQLRPTKFMDVHCHGIDTITTTPPPPPNCPLIGWNTLLLMIDWNSRVWLSPSHFLHFSFNKPGLRMSTNTETGQVKDCEGIFAELNKRGAGLDSMIAPLSRDEMRANSH